MENQNETEHVQEQSASYPLIDRIEAQPNAIRYPIFNPPVQAQALVATENIPAFSSAGINQGSAATAQLPQSILAEK